MSLSPLSNFTAESVFSFLSFPTYSPSSTCLPPTLCAPMLSISIRCSTSSFVLTPLPLRPKVPQFTFTSSSTFSSMFTADSVLTWLLFSTHSPPSTFSTFTAKSLILLLSLPKQSPLSAFSIFSADAIFSQFSFSINGIKKHLAAAKPPRGKEISNKASISSNAKSLKYSSALTQIFPPLDRSLAREDFFSAQGCDFLCFFLASDGLNKLASPLGKVEIFKPPELEDPGPSSVTSNGERSHKAFRA
uniref:PHD finger protein 14-like n=1 Tax=Rhizophora mucronata TaxID=61149 RepID=A0A2P2MIP1_RHIMU